MNTTRVDGQHYEDLALAFLSAQGLILKTRNFTCKLGECDLIMQHPSTRTVVFVEVRKRQQTAYGNSVESITYQKQQKLIRTAHYYLKHLQGPTPPCRFDVIAFDGKNAQPQWIPNAFSASAW